MYHRGNCWDNVAVCNFKKQTVYGERFLTGHEVQRVIVECIECYCNRIGAHLNIGWLSLVDYEAENYHGIEAASVHLID